ncbi:MAG: CBS domain-containing protein [Candidatus Zixiibacteriota bacterium]|nr:MAG: CBS domain-containing protein [candidate division Zixibacteria bacterium]
MQGIRVSEIMIPLDKYPHILLTSSLREAMKLFEVSILDIDGQKSLPRGILVFDEEYRLVGIAGRRDILRGLEPDFLAEKPLEFRMELFNIEIDTDQHAPFYKRIMEAALEQTRRSVKDVMRPVGITVDYNDHIFKAIYLMNSHHMNLLPVLKDNEVIGVVRTVDVFHKVVDLLLK